jgi:hypothetical protein
MKEIFPKIWYGLCHPRYQLLLRCGVSVLLMSICLGAFADGDDLLKGTDASWWATFNGTGKNYLYASEGVIALLGFIKTRNPGVLVGIVIVAIFVNIILYFAGQNG